MMKFLGLTVVCLVAFAKADNSAMPNFDAQFKMIADNFEAAAKKFEELSGMKTEFDKEKFLGFLKTTSTNFAEQMKTLNEKLMKDSKMVPEDLKKKYDELTKQVSEMIKGLQSPDVKAKAEKLQETLSTNVKEIGKQVNELSKSFGLSVPPQIQKGLSEMYEELLKTSKVIQEKGQKIAEGIQDELKKKKN